ncbi:MAG: hypothetical protein IJT41_05070 [Clostridia bacterium]|nr:hypothetical protein [Clostridia bacterium]
MKKVLSALLTVALCLCCANIAFAQSEEPAVYGEILNNQATSDLIVVLTYDGAYSQVGELPSVTLKSASQEDTALSADSILQQVYFYEETYYPQLFIRLPETDESVYKETMLYVSAGAFQDKNGNESSAVSKEIEYLHSARYDVQGHSDYVIPDTRIFSDSKNYVLVGTSVTTSYDNFVRKNEDMWENASKLYVGNDEIYTDFTPQEADTYTITCKLNDFVWDEYSFTAMDKTHAHWQGIRSSFILLVESPVLFLAGIGLTFILPGWGWVLGPGSIMGALVAPIEFIESLFRTPYESGTFL